MIPITSSAGCVLRYSLWSRTVSPRLTCARGPVSAVHVDIDRIRCALIGSNVATDLQIDVAPWLSLVASTATPWPWTCPAAAITSPGTFTFQSQWVSEKSAGIPPRMEYSESPQLLMSSHTGLSGSTGSLALV